MAAVFYFESFHISTFVFIIFCQLESHKTVDGALVQLPQYANHEWKSGAWGDCYTPTGCGDGVKERNVWCADKDGYKSLQTNCDPNKKPEETKRCFKVCRRHGNSVRWRTGKWGPCSSSNSSTSCRESPGVKKRIVMCVHRSKPSRKDFRVIDDEACLLLHPKPTSTKPCTTTCPQDCVVSKYGEWSECESCGFVNRTRTRRVLVAPEHGGKSCPPLTETDQCFRSRECLRHSRPDYDFAMKLGPWGPCISSLNWTKTESRRPVAGYRTRNASCINGAGEKVHTSWCTSRSILPSPTVETCVISTDCVVTGWTQWSMMTEGCITSNGRVYPEIRARYRKVALLSEGNGAPCPPLMEKRVIMDKLPPCYSRYNWTYSYWSSCSPYNSLCGGGLKRRNVICIRIVDSVPVHESFCKEQPPSTIEQCNVVCPQECIVSSWSSWGACLPLNGKDSQQYPSIGYQERRRQIIQAPSADEAECSALVEVDSCQEPVVVKWVTGNWSACLLRDVTQPCGEGVRKRDAVCVTPSGERTSSSLCDIHSLPPKVLAPCYIPCPRDCVLAEWTEWSPCTVTCSSSSGGGIRRRGRRVLAEHGSGGKPCPAPDTLIETDTCGYNSCSGYSWEKTYWSTCRTVKKPGTCGKGVQNREVKCVRSNGIMVSDKKCAPEPKPPVERACDIPCPVDCVTTNFTEWTPCPDNCRPGSTRSRIKYILQPPLNGGAPCPSKLEETRQCSYKDNPRCSKKTKSRVSVLIYRWEVAAWSRCYLPPGVNCGIGQQTRKVSCLRNDGREVQPHFCLSNIPTEPPPSSRDCETFCDKSCTVSQWSSWRRANASECSSSLLRIREAVGEACGSEILKETKLSPVGKMAMDSDSEWSSCIISKGSIGLIKVNDRSIAATCGPGRKYRRGNEIDGCGQIGLKEEACVVECPESCQTSEWTEWTTCNITCGQGYRHRQRHILKFGRQCPPVSKNIEIQEEVCEVSCDQYQWVTGEWSECDIRSSTEKRCGEGNQRRTVSCRKISGMHLSRNLDESFCDPTTRPPSTVQCVVSCPDDCVVSSWSSWSECKEPCNMQQHRQRNRTVLRMALPSAGIRCPSLVEEEPCKLGSNCFHHKWVIGDWSSCILPYGASCGRGYSTRAAACVRNNGRYVSTHYCPKLSASPLKIPCNVECPIDCEMSEWSEWKDEECKPCNDQGKRWRSRYIAQHPSNTGQQCPSELVQKVSCLASCYHWSVTAWSSCKLQGADCGHGYKSRVVRCLRSDGVEVDREHCLRVNVTEDLGEWIDIRWLEEAHGEQEQEHCEVPCSGDCSLTPWSSWGPCHRDCSIGHVTGYQTRSRAIISPAFASGETCPSRLWEKRPCWGGPCLTYSWRLKDGSIHCLRSDDVIVHGGCDSMPRPCYPACTAKQSYCDHMLGQCLCAAGYSPVYNASKTGQDNAIPQFINCVAVNSMDVGHNVNHTTTSEEIILRYFPDDNEFSFWMYAMICVGTAFVIFVIVTVYLMCSQKPAARNQEASRAVDMKPYPR